VALPLGKEPNVKKSRLSLFSGGTTARLDINGDCRINAFDLSAYNGYYGSTPVEKPKNHPSCQPE